jgi:selenocysteine lyase/cysteine desulfurase
VLRALAASVIGAEATDIAITCSVSYGLATARRNLPLAAGDWVLVLEDDHGSQLLTWAAHAQACNASVHPVPRPPDRDWTSAILAHLQRFQGRPPAIASLGATFWRDGTQVDLPRVCAALHAAGTRIVLDLTQSAGVLDLDVRALHADFAMFPTYKWLLGPYSLAFLYAAPKWHQGLPLEENSFNRGPDGDYAAGAIRYDMGERDVFIGIATAISSLRLVAGWDRGAVRSHLGRLTCRLGESLRQAGLHVVPDDLRSPHILGAHSVPAGLAAACRRKGVIFTQRGSEIRISPHVFNTEADIETCVATIDSVLRDQ